MHLLTITIVLTVILAALYLWWRFQTVRVLVSTIVGNIARFCKLLSWVGLHIATACKQGCIACLERFESTETERSTTVSHLVGAAVARLVYLATSSILVVAGFPLDVLRTAAFYGLAAAHVSLQLDTLTALTWILMPGSWGLLLLETIGIVPVWARLLPQIHKRKVVTWTVGIIAATLFVVSLVTTFLFHTVTQCQLLAPACTTDVMLQVVIAGSFNTLLVAAACTLGVLGIIMGLLGLAGCVLAGCAFLFFLSHLAFGILGSLLLSLINVKHVPDDSSSLTTLSTNAISTPLLPITTSQDTQSTTDQEDMFMQNLRTNTIIGFGDVGYRLVPLLAETAQITGAATTLLAAGMVDVERIYRNETPLAVSGIIDVSPSRTVMHRILAEASGGNTMYAKIAYGINEAIVSAYSTKHGGTITIITNMLLLPFLAEPIRRLKVRLPNQHIMVVTFLPPKDLQDQLFQQAYEDLIALTESNESPIHCVEFNPNSSFALLAGEEIQERALAGAILGLCVAPLHDERNATSAEVGKRLSNYSPLIGMAFATASVAHGKTPAIWSVVKAIAPKAGNKGYGDVNDLLIQIRECMKQVMRDVAQQHTDTTIAPDAPVFLLCMVPLQLADKRFTEIVAAIHAHCKQTYPNARALVVRGSAPATLGSERGYRCGVTAYYPLPLLSFAQQDEPTETATLAEQSFTLSAKTENLLASDTADQKQAEELRQVQETPSIPPSLNGTGRRGRKIKLS